jgi:predicted membrane chloride channel (bestrophin family)
MFWCTCRHTTRFVLVYITFLPLALWPNLQFATLIFAPMITFLLTGIELIGIRIENPFYIFPMAAYCATIHRNVMYLAADWAAGNYVCSFHALYCITLL